MSCGFRTSRSFRCAFVLKRKVCSDISSQMNICVCFVFVSLMTSAAQRLRGAQSAVELDVYDDAAWTIVLNSARALSLQVGLPVYQQYLNVYPTSVRVIRAMIDHALSVEPVDVAAVDGAMESSLYRFPNAETVEKRISNTSRASRTPML